MCVVILGFHNLQLFVKLHKNLSLNEIYSATKSSIFNLLFDSLKNAISAAEWGIDLNLNLFVTATIRGASQIRYGSFAYFLCIEMALKTSRADHTHFLEYIATLTSRLHRGLLNSLMLLNKAFKCRYSSYLWRFIIFVNYYYVCLNFFLLSFGKYRKINYSYIYEFLGFNAF